jgi:uncharacterized membrane protein YhaH (DUF805 family)
VYLGILSYTTDSYNQITLVALVATGIILSIFSFTPIIYIFVRLIFIIPLSISRLHDIGYSGIVFLCTFLPIIGNILLIIMLCSPGIPEPNQYGYPLCIEKYDSNWRWWR